MDSIVVENEEILHVDVSTVDEELLFLLGGEASSKFSNFPALIDPLIVGEEVEDFFYLNCPLFSLHHFLGIFLVLFPEIRRHLSIKPQWDLPPHLALLYLQVIIGHDHVWF